MLGYVTSPNWNFVSVYDFSKKSGNFYSFPSQVPHNYPGPDFSSLQRAAFLIPSQGCLVVAPASSLLTCSLPSPGGWAGAEKGHQSTAKGLSVGDPQGCRFPQCPSHPLWESREWGTSALRGLKRRHSQNSLFTACFILFKKKTCRQKDPCSRRESLGVDSNAYGNLDIKRQKRWIIYSSIRTPGQMCGKTSKVNPSFTPNTKMNSKIIRSFNMKTETIHN